MTFLKKNLFACCIFLLIGNLNSYMWQYTPEPTLDSTSSTSTVSNPTTKTYSPTLNTTTTALTFNKLFKLKKSSPLQNNNQCSSNPCMVIIKTILNSLEKQKLNL